MESVNLLRHLRELLDVLRGYHYSLIMYFSDIFTTVIDFRWRWSLLIFCAIFVSCWMFYACLYSLIMYFSDIFTTVIDFRWRWSLLIFCAIFVSCWMFYACLYSLIMYFSDIFTTVIDFRWRWSLLIFCAIFVSCWMFYACLYYLVMYFSDIFTTVIDFRWRWSLLIFCAIFVSCWMFYACLYSLIMYFSDIFTTVIDFRWRWSLLIFCAIFVSCWMFYACLYYLIMYFSDIFTTVIDFRWRWSLLIFCAIFVSCWMFYACLYSLIMYFSDIFTTVIDFRWRWSLLIFCAIFVSCWMFYACLYSLIMYFSDIFTTVIDFRWRWSLLIFCAIFVSCWMFYACLYSLIMYFSDIFTTVIDFRWRWSLLIFCAIFVSCWMFYACLYYLIMYVHGDFDHDDDDANHTSCIMNIKDYSFTSTFLFSVETQVTIGYGYRYVTENCPLVVTLICSQSLLGLIIQSLMAGVIFSKIARPKKRAETLLFSRHAVINQRDGKLCFMFRVGDMRTSHLVEAHVRLQMIKKRVTEEGELLPFHQFDMDVGYDLGTDRIFLVWPLTISHMIDERSPLYDYSAKQLASARFEIVVILEGIVESTGMTTQARTSYIPSEILWGHRFEKLVTYQRDNGEYRIDHEHFHRTYEVDTPTCSAKESDQRVSNSSDGLLSPNNPSPRGVSTDDLSFDLSSPDRFRSRTPSSPTAKHKNVWMRNGSLKPEILVQSPSISNISNSDELQEVITT